MAAFGLFVAVLGIAGVVAPTWLLDRVTGAQARLGVWGLGAFRILIGVVLLLAAAASRAPLYLEILGWLSILSGALTPIVGARGLEAVLSWWRARPAAFVRAWSAFVCVFGASLVWAVSPGLGIA